MLYTEANNKSMRLRMTLQEMASTKSSYQEYLDERNTIKLILDAVSSKEGIPLVMVKIFLDECKEIINDLISDIFDDDLEIINFDISESSNEFKIPYRINGNEVPDIELASQGQQAVISIALSFALCRKSMFDYNIMLLDEIDNSIYKADREKFIMILAKQMQALGTEQVFLITHNDIFQQSGLPVNIIMTTPEVIDSYPNQSIIQIY
jgi:DNA repair exonuclease SbcCD ATPase subunit